MIRPIYFEPLLKGGVPADEQAAVVYCSDWQIFARLRADCEDGTEFMN
jgi:hypothetical protein